MPLTNTNFLVMCARQYNEILHAISNYSEGLDDSIECQQEERELHEIIELFRNFMFNNLLAGLPINLTPSRRLEGMNRLIEFYNEINDVLINQEWEGNFDFNDMRNAFVSELDVGFLITQAETHLDIVNTSINEHAESLINQDDRVEADPLFARILQVRVLLRVLRQQATIHNIQNTIQQVIVHMHTLDLYLDYNINQLDMTYDVSMPLFFTLYPADLNIAEVNDNESDDDEDDDDNEDDVKDDDEENVKDDDDENDEMRMDPD